MKTTILILVASLLATSATAQLQIDGKPASSTATYVTAVFISKNVGNTLLGKVDDGEREGTLTDAKGEPIVFTGPAHLLNYMNAQGWEYAGSASTYFTSGKGLTEAAPRAMPDATVFVRRP